jgi:SAM-dependent methyltransferase
MASKRWNPGELLKLSGGYWMTCALHAGVKLNVFTEIGDRTAAADALAQRLGADPRALEMLLNALTAMELLERKEGAYRNTEISRVFLSESSPKFLGHMILHHHQLMESWAHLDESVKTGKPLRNRSSRDDDRWRENFLMGMFNSAMQQAPLVVDKIDLSNRKFLLDLGGGPGTYAIHFCKRNPSLKAAVYDLPTTRPFAEKTIHRFGLSGRIEFHDIDYLKEGLKGRFDVVWMSHILHGERPEEARRIVQKAASVLDPGGMILIHEFILNDSMDGPLFPTLFSLNMLLGTEGGQAYSEGQLKEMLFSAGIRDIHRIPIESPNDSGIMVGTL